MNKNLPSRICLPAETPSKLDTDGRRNADERSSAMTISRKESQWEADGSSFSARQENDGASLCEPRATEAPDKKDANG